MCHLANSHRCPLANSHRRSSANSYRRSSANPIAFLSSLSFVFHLRRATVLSIRDRANRASRRLTHSQRSTSSPTSTPLLPPTRAASTVPPSPPPSTSPHLFSPSLPSPTLSAAPTVQPRNPRPTRTSPLAAARTATVETQILLRWRSARLRCAPRLIRAIIPSRVVATMRSMSGWRCR
jgi:hypothetical protein